MKAYWDEKKKCLVFDGEGDEIRGDFSDVAINHNLPEIRNFSFYNTATKVKAAEG